MVPALATTAVFTFTWTWNEFFAAIVYLTVPGVFTVPVALGQFVDAQSASNWGAMFAMSIVSLVPVFFAFLFGQRFLIKGIATTGIK
jgi:multiple sugar transport system permease protein